MVCSPSSTLILLLTLSTPGPPEERWWITLCRFAYVFIQTFQVTSDINVYACLFSDLGKCITIKDINIFKTISCQLYCPCLVSYSCILCVETSRQSWFFSSLSFTQSLSLSLLVPSMFLLFYKFVSYQLMGKIKTNWITNAYILTVVSSWICELSEEKVLISARTAIASHGLLNVYEIVMVILLINVFEIVMVILSLYKDSDWWTPLHDQGPLCNVFWRPGCPSRTLWKEGRKTRSDSLPCFHNFQSFHYG